MVESLTKFLKHFFFPSPYVEHYYRLNIGRTVFIKQLVQLASQYNYEGTWDEEEMNLKRIKGFLFARVWNDARISVTFEQVNSQDIVIIKYIFSKLLTEAYSILQILFLLVGIFINLFASIIYVLKILPFFLIIFIYVGLKSYFIDNTRIFSTLLKNTFPKEVLEPVDII